MRLQAALPTAKAWWTQHIAELRSTMESYVADAGDDDRERGFRERRAGFVILGRCRQWKAAKRAVAQPNEPVVRHRQPRPTEQDLAQIPW